MREIKWLALITFICFYSLLFAKLPEPFALLLAAGILWKFLALQRSLAAPPRAVLLSLGSLSFIYLSLSAPSTWHHPTWSAGLLLLSLLWLCDRPHPMQIMMVHLTFFALLVTILMQPGQIYPLPLYFLLTCLIFASLMHQHMDHISQVSLIPLLQTIAKTAIPASLILLPVYFFFPELRPTPQDRAISGLNFSLEPGRYASLVESQRVAFRAYFPTGWGSLDASQFYWRLGVLDDSFGMVWKRKEDSETWIKLGQQSRSDGINYELLSEERLGKNLPYLEYFIGSHQLPVDEKLLWNPNDLILQGNQSLVRLIAGKQSLYTAKYTPSVGIDKIQTSLRVKTFAESLAPLKLDEKLAAMRSEFKAFRYSLQPGKLLSDDPLDEFFFQTRQGYCEHFAAAFASIMRLSGTPARIIIGFQGGTILEDQRFLLVRDRDAHAWTEVWDGARWLRVDPTSMVPGAFREAQNPGWFAYLSAYVSYLNRHIQDIVASIWPSSELLNILIFISLGIILLVLSRKVLKPSESRPIWERDLKALLKQGALMGCQRLPSEPFAHYLKRLGQTSQTNALALEALIPQLNECLYGSSISAEAHRELRIRLKYMVRELKKST